MTGARLAGACIVLSSVLNLGSTVVTGNDARADAAGKQLISSFSSLTQTGSLGKTVDGQEMVAAFKAAADELSSYSFVYKMTVYKGKKTIYEQGNFYFKKPRLLRVEEVGDYKRGAVAVIGKDGRIRGRLGGALSPFAVTLSENSDLLLSANGYPMVDSDFASMARVTQRFLQQGMKSRVTAQPVQVDGQPNKVYVIEILKANEGSEIFKRAYIDPETLLPVEWFDYNNGRLFARTIWTNLRLNANLSDELFKL